MKLHLPCALRGALLAAVTLASTTPTWAGWSGDSFLMTAEDVATANAGNLTITTAENAPGSNGWFLRSYYDENEAPAEGALSATINELTLTKHDSGTPTLNVAGHWNAEKSATHSFTNLTINTLNVSSDYTSDSLVTIKVASGNTLSVNSVTGGATAFTIEEGATLHLSFTDFAGMLQTNADGDPLYRNDSNNTPTRLYTGGLASTITGAGTLVLHGSVDWELVDNNFMGGVLWSTEAYSANLNFSFTGTIDISNLTVRLPDGYTGGVTNGVDNQRFVVQAAKAGVERIVVAASANPSASYTSSSFTTSSFGQLQGAVTNASKTWTLRITGTLTNPGAGNTQDVILLSTTEITGASGRGEHGLGNFCLYLTSTGQLVLHSKENSEDVSKGLSTWTLVEGLANGATWTEGSYDITLSYGAIGGGYSGFIFDKDSSLILNGTAMTMPAYDRAVTTETTKLNTNLLNELYTRLPGGSSASVTVTGDAVSGGVYWRLISDISVEGLREGIWPTDAGVPMEDTDIIKFAGGALRSGTDESPNVIVSNPIEAEADAFVRLAPSANTSLIITHGEAALTSGAGLTIEGGSGSRVELQGVSTSAPQKITLSAETSLGISGPDTLTIDASLNTFDPTSSLSKLDGGNFIYIAKANDHIASLSNTSGELEIQGTVAANSLEADSLKLVESGAQAAATNVSVASLTLGNPNSWNGTFDNALTADTLTATSRIDMAAGTHLSANAVKTNGLMLIGGSRIDVGNGSLEVTGENSADVGGVLASNTISVTGHNGYANLRGFVLTGDSLTAASLKDALVTVGPQKAPRSTSAGTTLELTSVANSLIRVEADTTIRNSHFAGSSVEHHNGTLMLQDSSLDATSTITSTVVGGGVSLSNTTFHAGSSLTVDGTTYTITSQAIAMALTGTATGTEMALSQIFIDATGSTAEQSNLLFLDSGSGYVNMSNCNIVLHTAPGMVASLQVDANGNLVYSVREDMAGIIREVANTANSQAAIPALQAGAANGGELAALYTYVIDSSRESLAERRSALQQLTSGSITMLADSQRQGVVNTINNIRNRVVQMGNPQGIEYEKNVHVWLTADGANNDIEQDAGAAGYEYQTWGGTAGIHVDAGNFSFGAAVSASYGELTAHSNDRAEGDHDSMTLSAFVRHQSGRWMQMGILSLGRNELEMERSVHDYRAEGDTSGFTATAYYEAGYTFSLTEESTQVLQPIASIMLTSARMDGFSENGSIGNAALCTETEDYTYGTVGIGARYQLVLAEDVNERPAFLEVRAKLVQDFGDKTNETTVRFAGVPGSPFSVSGADVGRTGFQFGAGISIPAGVYTTLFADVDADMRSGATSVSGNVGVRVEF